MPDVKKIKLNRVTAFYREVIRDIAGYMPGVEDGVERKAIQNKDKTHLNRLYIDRDCLHAEKGSRHQTAKIEEYYRERYGKNPKSDAKAVALFMALPRDYIPNHFTDEEYSALLDELYGNPHANRKVLEKAHEKILSRNYSEEELERIYDYFEKSVPVVCKVFGIKEEDILYFALHVDESFPHIQAVFMPGMYIADQKAWQEYCDRPVKGDRPKTLLGDTNRTIGPEEEPVGCSVERIDKLFLKMLNKNFEDAFMKLGIEAHISNGRGQINDVQNTGKEQRKAAAIARGVEEEAKRRTESHNKQIIAQKAQIMENEKTIQAQKAELAQDKEIIEGLKKDIDEAKTELKGLKKAIRQAKSILEGMCNRVTGLIGLGLDKIKKARNHKEKDDVAKAAEEQLIRIKTDADAVMTMFMPFNDDEEEEKRKADPEEEYNGDERDDM